MPFNVDGYKPNQTKHRKPYTKQKPSSQAGIKYSKEFVLTVKKFNQKSHIVKLRFPTTTWAKQFDLLLKEINLDQKRLDKVLKWYSLHCTDNGVPQAKRGETFRYKFQEIESAMHRWEKENPNIKVRKEFITMAYDSFGIAPGLDEDYWSPTFIKLFPLALQLTHDNYKDLFFWVCNHETYNEYYLKYLPEPETLVFDWWKELGESWFFDSDHRKVNPLSLIFTLKPHNNSTTRWINWWVNQHGHTLSRVNNMIKEYKSQMQS